MAAAKDILLDSDNELVVFNGDFKIGFSDQQHVEAIIRTFLGHWKESPLVGVGIDYYRASPIVRGKLKREITDQLDVDGFRVDNITITDNNEYIINAQRINGNI